MTDRYDAGLLNDFGGGDVSWWHDYLRAEIDRSSEFHADIHELQDAEIARLRKALQFYADTWCFTTNPKRGGLEWKPKEALLDDCGNTARAAIAGEAA